MTSTNSSLLKNLPGLQYGLRDLGMLSFYSTDESTVLSGHWLTLCNHSRSYS